jgi:hypothetical protein
MSDNDPNKLWGMTIQEDETLRLDDIKIQINSDIETGDLKQVIEAVAVGCSQAIDDAYGEEWAGYGLAAEFAELAEFTDVYVDPIFISDQDNESNRYPGLESRDPNSYSFGEIWERLQWLTSSWAMDQEDISRNKAHIASLDKKLDALEAVLRAIDPEALEFALAKLARKNNT